MSGQEMQTRVASLGDADHEQMVIFCEAFRAALAAVTDGEPDPNMLGVAAMSACMFAGTIFGTLIVGGVARDADKKRAADMAARNFRAGVDVGKKRAMRIAREDVEGHA